MKIQDRTGQKTWSEYRIDHDGAKVDVQHFEDVTQIMRENAYLRSLPDNLKSKEGNRLTARLSPTMASELTRLGILQDPKRFKQWLNHPDNAKWRTTEGKL